MNDQKREKQRENARRYYYRHREEVLNRIKTKYSPVSKKRAAERQAKEERLLSELVETYDNLVVELLKLVRTVRR